MTKVSILLLGAALFRSCSWAQDAPPPTPEPSLAYTPPTQAERLQTYLRHTFSIASVLEAGARAGIDQARNVPGEWPQGAEGYAERFGSAFGSIAVRGTTEYLIADLFREDLRRSPCGSKCTTSAFKRAFDDTFTARKGDDGHRTFSVARLLGPVSAGVVVGAWRPDFGRRDIPREIGLNYGFAFVRNLIRDMVRH